MSNNRGADLLARTLTDAGVAHVFSLSGNHVMPLYDAMLDARVQVVHTRHENAAVHMADAYARLTGKASFALLTGGPGHANGIGALYTALASESPVVLLSGHAPLSELGTGSFQEMRQAEMAAPVVKASWTAASAAGLGDDIARAVRIATSGRPGPVHVSLPVDVLEGAYDGEAERDSPLLDVEPRPLSETAVDAVIAMIAAAARPLVLTGPVMAEARAGELRATLARALDAPVLCMESPRGLNDPSLGGLARVVARADLVVLLGKEPDFTLKFARAPGFAKECRFVVVDPEAAALARALDVIGHERVVLSTVADTVPTARRLIERASGLGDGPNAWTAEVEEAVRYRSEEVPAIASSEGPLHPLDIGREVQRALDAAWDSVFVSDGGEFGQWAQACISSKNRLINGQGGSIGSAVPFALAAKVARPGATVIALTGDGAAGFHLMEIETAVRCGLAPVIVVGNDACWNAEHQIQIRSYGKDRALYTELSPTRYDQVAIALGGHGEHVTRAADFGPALDRAIASRKPAVVNVVVQRLAAPTVKMP
ncbi:MAG TPA: thiamine pyrophosphate-binding protein [Burkholderiales bacterium]|nr:thiamine pyrophosphate-binding protein [Burkholderiales bacterium]